MCIISPQMLFRPWCALSNTLKYENIMHDHYSYRNRLKTINFITHSEDMCIFRNHVLFYKPYSFSANTCFSSTHALYSNHVLFQFPRAFSATTCLSSLTCFLHVQLYSFRNLVKPLKLLNSFLIFYYFIHLFHLNF